MNTSVRSIIHIETEDCKLAMDTQPKRDPVTGSWFLTSGS